MKKSFITFVAFMLISFAVSSQDYQTGIGVRGGISSGLIIKHFFASQQAIEGLIAARWGGFHITGLYEFHHNIFNIQGLYGYYGFGGHYGYWSKNSDYPEGNGIDNHNAIGIDGILGIEYNFSQIPFNISLDYIPSFNPINKPKFWLYELGFSIRYTFGTR